MKRSRMRVCDTKWSMFGFNEECLHDARVMKETFENQKRWNFHEKKDF